MGAGIGCVGDGKGTAVPNVDSVVSSRVGCGVNCSKRVGAGRERSVGAGIGSVVGAGIDSVVGAGIDSVVGAVIGSVVGAGIGTFVGAGTGSFVGSGTGGNVTGFLVGILLESIHVQLELPLLEYFPEGQL